MNCFVEAQEVIAERLASSAYFADIPIRTEAKGTITEDIAQSLASAGLEENANGKAGIAIVLRTPAFKNLDPDSIGLALSLLPVISIYENPLINQGATGINKPALDVVHAVLFLVHGYRKDCGPPHSITDGDSEENRGIMAYHLTASVPGAINGLPT